MPRFNCTIEFTLRSSIEPDGVHFDAYGINGVEDISDDSSWYEADVTSDGGRVTCVIVADSEEEANERAAEIVNEGSEVEDRNGLTWLIEDINVDLEEIEEPWTRERAKTVISLWLGEADIPEDVREAFRFLLDQFVV